MQVTLKNEEIQAVITSLGGELISLQDIRTGREYLWSGDAVYWSRQSPILFPFVGSTKNKEYTAKGKKYAMTQHGFARDCEFIRAEPFSDTECWFALTSDEEMRVKYPYDFRLMLGYRLEGRKLRVLWKVENPARETLCFSIGGHPGFYCPIEEGKSKTDYKIGFDTPDRVVSTVISNMGLATDEKITYMLDNGKLDITEDLFAQDALVFEGHQAHNVSLIKEDGKAYLTVTFDAPLFGIWAPYKEGVPFICIEPWYGRCDHENFTGTLEEREWGNRLEHGGTWEASYSIDI